MGSMRGKTKKNTLYVQMFGGFSLSYEGKLITGGVKSRESQFVYLMQILLHERGLSCIKLRISILLILMG